MRSRNEDIAFVGDSYVRNDAVERTLPDTTPIAIGVADGVGGAAAGDIASRLVAEQIADCCASLQPGLSPEELHRTLTAHCFEANNELIRRGMLHPNEHGMATTATAVLLYAGARWLVHAGDSRCYHYDRTGLRQISRDHSLRAMTGNPQIPGNIIANCFGGDEQFFVDVAPIRKQSAQQKQDDHEQLHTVPASENDGLLLLCSDGLSDMLSDDEIEGCITGTSADSIVQTGERLIARAKRRAATTISPWLSW